MPFTDEEGDGVRRVLCCWLLCAAGLSATAWGGEGGGDIWDDSLAEAVAVVVFDPHREVVLSAQISERVEEIPHRLGEVFEADEPLVVLASEVLEQRLARARAKQRVAEANLTAAETLYREQGALKRARSEVKLAEAQLAVVKRMVAMHTERRKAEAILEVAKANVEATRKLHEDNAVSGLELANAEKDLVVAEAGLERAKASEETEVVRARKELAAAQARLEEAKASLQPNVERARTDAAVARANVALAEKDLEGATVRAPFHGRVEKVYVQVGELTQRGQKLLKVYNEETLLGRFLVPSRLHGEVTIGMPVTIEVTEAGQTTTGQIARIGKIDTVSESFEVFAEVENADEQLRAGMQGVVELEQFAPAAGTPR